MVLIALNGAAILSGPSKTCRGDAKAPAMRNNLLGAFLQVPFGNRIHELR